MKKIVAFNNIEFIETIVVLGGEKPQSVGDRNEIMELAEAAPSL